MEGNDEGRNSHREKVMGYEAGQANQKTEGEEPRVLNMELRNSGREKKGNSLIFRLSFLFTHGTWRGAARGRL
jgi:hypothetical protein